MLQIPRDGIQECLRLQQQSQAPLAATELECCVVVASDKREFSENETSRHCAARRAHAHSPAGYSCPGTWQSGDGNFQRSDLRNLPLFCNPLVSSPAFGPGYSVLFFYCKHIAVYGASSQHPGPDLGDHAKGQLICAVHTGLSPESSFDQAILLVHPQG